MVRPENEHPALPVAQALLLEPDTIAPIVPFDRIGDPFGVDGPLSGGRGGPGGIGDGGCCGVGDGNGSRLGGDAAVVHAPRAKVARPPQLIYKVEPEYSEEARKAQFQGVVVLAAEIDASGAVQSLRIIRPLGLGLDEKAIAAASLWRFRPAMAEGRPVSYPVTIEVNFRLL
jgi:TonB family protein